MKKLALTKQDMAPLALLMISLLLLLTGVFLKSLVVLAGFTGLVAAWFLCIDTIIANNNMNMIKRIVFGGIVIIVPLMFSLYLGS